MILRNPHRQLGITFLGFLIAAAIAGCFALTGMVVFPMYQEYYEIKMAAKGMATEPGVARMDPLKIHQLFERRLNVNYVEDLKREQVQLTRIENGWHMHIDYQSRRPWFKNLEIIGSFQIDQDLTNAGAATEE